MNSARLKKMISTLSSGAPAARRSAAEALGEADERALYPLIRALRDENPGVQDAAMRSLIRIGGEQTAYMTVPLLREESLLRNTAIIILREIGPASVPLLYPLLKDKDDDVRKFAIDLMMDIKTDVDYRLIWPLMHDPNPNVRAAAAKAAGVFRDPESIPYLIEALWDEEWVCFSVLEAIGEIGDDVASASVAEILDGHSEPLRYAAIEALGKIGSAASAGILLRHFHSSQGFERKAALKSLIRLGEIPQGEEAATEILIMFAESDWDDRMICLRAISGLRDMRAVRLLADTGGALDPSDPENEDRLMMIKDTLRSYDCARELIVMLEDSSVKFRGKTLAIEVLGELRCAEAVPSLVRLLEADIRDVRRASIKALGGMNDEAAREALIGAVDDYDSHVRKAAVAALGRIGDDAAFEPVIGLLAVEKYRDVIEEGVRALMSIDRGRLLVRAPELPEAVRDIVSGFEGA